MEKLRVKFWSDDYFHAAGKKWVKDENQDGKVLKRAFCQFIMDPICKLC
jgi:elongation factor 2